MSAAMRRADRPNFLDGRALAPAAGILRIYNLRKINDWLWPNHVYGVLPSSGGGETAMPGEPTPPDRGTLPFPTPHFDAARLIETNQRAMRAAFEAQSHGFQHMAKIGTSVFEFLQRRVQHDADLAQRLGTAKAPEDALAAYHDFVDTAIEEYSAEFTALATLYADQTKEAMHDAERQVGELARPILAAAE
jgi:hypothetical protein